MPAAKTMVLAQGSVDGQCVGRPWATQSVKYVYRSVVIGTHTAMLDLSRGKTGDGVVANFPSMRRDELSPTRQNTISEESVKTE